MILYTDVHSSLYITMDELCSYCLELSSQASGFTSKSLGFANIYV